MALSETELRALREIEQALSLSDAALAAYLTTGKPPQQIARSVAGVFVVVAALLVVAGTVLPDAGMITGGWLVLLMMPPTIGLIVAVQGRAT